MKKMLLVLALALGSQFVIASEPAHETKKICVDVKDKEGKDKTWLEIIVFEFYACNEEKSSVKEEVTSEDDLPF